MNGLKIKQNGLCLILCVIALTSLATMNSPLFADEIQRAKIGLALSGGGARGAAHIGVIRELERLNIPVDYIAGTSMGAIVGGLYAGGMTAEQLENVLNSIDWEDVFTDRSPRSQLSVRRKQEDAFFAIDKETGIKNGRIRFPRGFIGGQKFYLVLKEHTLRVGGINDFDDLPIPFRAVASDLTTGEAVVLGSGDLANAIRASMAVPALVAPVDLDGKLLVDGGIANNLPVDIVREMGADIVIAVDISTPLQEKEDLESPISIVGQLTNLLTRRNAETQIASLSTDDVLITPELEDIGASDFKRVSEAVEAGRLATVKLAGRLKKFKMSDVGIIARVTSSPIDVQAQPIVRFIRIENDSAIPEQMIRSHLTVRVGEPLDIKTIETDIGSLYGLDVFETVRYNVVEEQGRSGVVISVKEKPWGPNYLQFGLRFSTDLLDDNRLDLRFGLLRTPANRFGAEWRSVIGIGEEPRIMTELYQPLGFGSPYFVLPNITFKSDRFNLQENGQITSENRVRSVGISAAVGRELDNWGQVMVGLARARSDVDTRVGEPSVPQGSFDDGEAFIHFVADTLDDIHFPTTGWTARTDWLFSETGLGADEAFQQFKLDISAARSWGKNTVLGGVRYFTTYGGEAPLQRQFRAGGLFNLPGFTENELSGQHFALLRLGFMRRVGSYLNFPVYVGGTLQQGNVFDDEDDIEFDNMLSAGSVFLGIDSLLGPLYLGFGIAEDSNENFSLLLGRGF